MKKILVIMMCVIVLCTLPVVAFAEDVDVVTEAATEAPAETADSNDLSVDMIVEYVQAHIEEVSVIATLILTIFYNMRKHGLLNKSITTLNNNSVAVAENSKLSISEVGAVVTAYKEEMIKALEEIRRNDEDRTRLEDSLDEVAKYLKATRLANTELANEVAELLILANIPNSKKDELYARHLAAVNAITEAMSIAEVTEEVKENEDEEQ